MRRSGPSIGIKFGIEYTHTIGVAELYDHEGYFTGLYYRTVVDPAIAKRSASKWARK